METQDILFGSQFAMALLKVMDKPKKKKEAKEKPERAVLPPIPKRERMTMRTVVLAEEIEEPNFNRAEFNKSRPIDWGTHKRGRH